VDAMLSPQFLSDDGLDRQVCIAFDEWKNVTNGTRVNYDA
jgi:hypothetical protein